MITGWGQHHFDSAAWGMNTEYTGPVMVQAIAQFPKSGLWDVHGDFMVRAEYENDITMLTSGGYTNGIRYEERGAGAVIRNNHITRNRIGVFAVIKCAGLTTFEENAINGNTDYDVKMGLEQKEDVPMSGNWWGTGDVLEISGNFFDGRREPGLGKVIFEPYMEKRP
jgi:hypothetical protein